ncbi:CAF17-like 4Fe-4S cluster assembly/insertion protein YgfZ [Nevskia soli]|uniref:CAF17-like 4Fe-4S cluster assembly/insertion protein YgfZ n=1 Tax=Nevskia soli TaxID=418856 RepID=UPI0014700A5D|nr:folate-binding protein YgfZ [Nevskia soli]
MAFGPIHEEAAAALTATVISPLAHLGAIRVGGAEAESFLQNQLSNDVRELSAARVQLASYNSAKGRVLDLFALRREGDAILLETRRDTLPATLKRLRMFVLRSKVMLEDLGDGYCVFGLAGAEAETLLAQANLPLPAQDWDWLSADDIIVLRRPGIAARYSVQAPAERLKALWKRFSTRARPVGSAAWELLDVLTGLPAIHPQTADHFVAQMLNLDRLGAISFTKGCYPGQEIVARMHYLGNLKRRMFLCRVEGGEAAPGTPVHAADGDAQAIGEVVTSAPHPDGGLALLAVLQLSHATDTQIRLGTADGAVLPVKITPEAA